MRGQRIAVIGAGISGLGCAWMLGRRHTVTLFEREDRLGGHSHTVDVPARRDRLQAVDTGFIVYNERNYPHLTALFRHLGVPTAASDMSFAVSVDHGSFEYSGGTALGLFAQPANLFRPRFHRMLREVLRFNREARAAATQGRGRSRSLGEFLDQGGYSDDLRERYLLPMAAAIWSCPTATMLAFPFTSLAHFFHNHGLLDLYGRPQWRTVVGGSREYVRRLTAAVDGQVDAGAPVVAVHPDPGGPLVEDARGERRRFDQVVVATHGDQAHALLRGAGGPLAGALGKFRYQGNRVVLHRDRALMPRRRRAWSAWNYLARSGARSGPSVSVTYWMNRLQPLGDTPDTFVSLNPVSEPDPALVLRELHYEHPVFDRAAEGAQSRIAALQGRDGLWLCGSYLGYGFHEDGLRSAVRVASALDAAPPWVPAPARSPVRPAPDAAPALPGGAAVARAAVR